MIGWFIVPSKTYPSISILVRELAARYVNFYSLLRFSNWCRHDFRQDFQLTKSRVSSWKYAVDTQYTTEATKITQLTWKVKNHDEQNISTFSNLKHVDGCFEPSRLLFTLADLFIKCTSLEWKIMCVLDDHSNWWPTALIDRQWITTDRHTDRLQHHKQIDSFKKYQLHRWMTILQEHR